ncbi:MAG TPA: phytanoyl-CoA dioxygenase family protein [Solirubrobacteraceae bacterium]|nr:phytanoyl-CoA dioxygenase family protein [Solirubrobacteraceae bacterium]
MKSIFRRATNDSAADALEAAAGLEAEGRALEAIELLNDANRKRRSAQIEERLVDTRHLAFSELATGASPAPAPEPVGPGEAPEDDGMPALAASQLTPGRIAGALASHGALIVRGLADPVRAKGLAAGIDRAFRARDAAADGAARDKTTPWYAEFAPEGDAGPAVKFGRGFVERTNSGVWTADSPRMMFDLLEMFDQAGVREVVTSYLGERPALSVHKGTLRRAKPSVGTPWWHQDGAFLGRGIRALNIWLSLSHSGRNAPGLEVVPKRLDGIVATGTDGADFDWSVADAVAQEVSGGEISRPVFAPGDAILFDDVCLHRTFTDPAMTATRYATETWFFAPSAYPDPLEQVPLAY